MITIKVPNKLTEIQFEQLLKDVNLSLTAGHHTIRFDFTGTEFISSFGMIEFVLLCEYLIEKENKRITLYLSNTAKLEPCMYVLARLGMFECLPDQVSFYPLKPKPKQSSRGKNDAILEVTKITDSEQAQDLFDRVEKAIKSNTTYNQGQVYDICTMVSEMVQNIFDHSESKTGGIIAIQNYRKIHKMQLVIADSGIGIPETLRNSKEYKNHNLSDIQAISESLKKGVSRHGKGAQRGEGLARCVELANKHGAQLYIRSNRGWVKIIFSQSRGRAGQGCLLPGTQIFVNFPSK